MTSSSTSSARTVRATPTAAAAIRKALRFSIGSQPQTHTLSRVHAITDATHPCRPVRKRGIAGNPADCKESQT